MERGLDSRIGTGSPSGAPEPVDLGRLASDLREAVRGEVQFDAAGRAMYATDAGNFRQLPLGVVCPKDAADVVAAIEVCREHGAPVLSRGAGTSLAGQCCNVAVVLDYTRHMNRILEIDPARRLARVQPGVVLDRLREQARQHGLTCGPDPSTHTHCTLGGMIGNNACGVHAQMAGRMSDNVHALEVVTYRGERLRVGAATDEEVARIVARGGRVAEIYAGLRDLRDRYADLIRQRYAPIPRRVSGYNLDELLPERGFHVARALVGSEGTCVAMVEATVRLVPEPGARVLLVLGFADIFEAAARVPEIVESGPIGLEGIDELLIEGMRARRMHVKHLPRLPDGEGFLLVEYGGDTREEAAEKACRLLSSLEGVVGHRLSVEPSEQDALWLVRESGLGVTARTPGRRDAWPGWEDSAVPPERLAEYLRDLRALFREYGYRAATYGHFGQGCVHCRIDFDLLTEGGVRQYRRFLEDAARLVVRYGGSLSGEHGDGQQRGELLPIQFGEELVDAMRQFKRLWDPDGAMNPGKVVDVRPLDADLRLGPAYQPVEPPVHFRYPEDDGRFSRAALRCVGVGKCRREGEGGTMCPSFKATREEMHSTRGRARLLWEMLQDDRGPIRDGFRSDAVHEALSLCLSCKGCKSDCPMQVDMATYKAEFYAARYEGRYRPREAWALGLIATWARLASWAPGLANLAVRAPVVGRIARWMARVHPDRQLPTFARQTFRSWFRRRAGRAGKPVLLWVDTWTDHFRPEVGRAAVEVLEAAGYAVQITNQDVCCGRPLYEHGFLDRAERLLRQCIEATRPAVQAGTPIVALEPSCASVFRDELKERFPDDADARALSEGVVSLAELLRGADLRPPLHGRKVVVHGHCHQKALWALDAEREVLEGMGADVEILDNGCCGMAGAFGYDAERYDVSVRVAEIEVLPHLERAGREALVMADGFSCRGQIEDLTARRGLHLAEIVRMALAEPAGQVREERVATGIAGGVGPWLAVGAGLVGGWLLYRSLTRE